MYGRYDVFIKTGTIKGAGTDSGVFITLYDQNGRSTLEHNLDTRGDNFEKGMYEHFRLYDRHVIEKIRSYKIRKDNKNKYADWFVEYIKVRDHQNKKEYKTDLHRWFTKYDHTHEIFPETAQTNRFTVITKTGTLKGAGTDSRVLISFQDVDGNTSQEYNLDEKGDDFEKGAVNTFYIHDKSNLKDLKQIIIRKENNGSNADWYAESVEIIDNYLNKSYDFLLNKWFTAGSRMSVIPVSQDKTTYKIGIKTGEESRSGTNAKMYITLYGTRGVSACYELDNQSDNFEKGDYDHFEIESPINLGTITKVKIGHDNGGHNSGWYCSYIRVEDAESKIVWSAPVNRWFSITDDDRKVVRTITLRPGEINDVGDVYWCARDADVIGNHHFILLRYRNLEQCKRICSKYNLEYDAEKKGSKTHYFTTIGCFAKNMDELTILKNLDPFNNYWGPLRVIINHDTDVKSVEQWIDPENNISYIPLYDWELDLDLERHYMSPIAAGYRDDEELMGAVIKATQNFMKHYPNVPDYDLTSRNCTTWANSLFRAIGYSESYRKKKNDFDGYDRANNNIINSHYFE